ncbi:MAG: zinc ribbon domain-containing protein [Paludibacteraceae bacterium]|nr:zinc ribbon domain-containing protein [Paludibacteraceae bacterium]
MENYQSQHQQQQSEQYRQIRQSQQVGGKKCFHCGASITLTAEICPVCGRPTNPNICTFCGSPMDPEDKFCGECGNSRDGIVCPDCGTLNFRSFCRKCNHPLDYMAKQAIQEAQNDPVYKRMCELQQQMVQLEKQILDSAELLDSEEAEEQVQELSEQDKALVDEYEQLLNMLQGNTIEAKTETPKQQVVAEPKKKVKLNVNLDQMRQITEAYKECTKQMNEMMQDLAPDPGMTPQMQRNYYSARKLPIVTVTRTKEIIQKPIEWICNYCGCHHSQPSECCEPQLGGTWVYENIEVERMITSKRWEYEE